MLFKGKRAIVTGAAGGIGAVTAALMAQEGAAVVVADINEEQGEQTVAGIRDKGGQAHFVRTDVTKESDLKALINRGAELLGGLDTLFNNAGAQRSGAVEQFEQADWDLLMAVNPRSCFLAIKHAVPILRDGGGGSIINMSSLAGVKGGPGTDRVLRIQGRHRGIHQGALRRTRALEDPGELRLPRMDRHTVQPAGHQFHGRTGGPGPSRQADRPDGQARNTGRDRPHGGVSRLGRIDIHDGSGTRHRRRGVLENDWHIRLDLGHPEGLMSHEIEHSSYPGFYSAHLSDSAAAKLSRVAQVMIPDGQGFPDAGPLVSRFVTERLNQAESDVLETLLATNEETLPRRSRNGSNAWRPTIRPISRFCATGSTTATTPQAA